MITDTEPKPEVYKSIQDALEEQQKWTYKNLAGDVKIYMHNINKKEIALHEFTRLANDLGGKKLMI